MEKWFKTCLLLCLAGFLLEARPNESFGVEYLTGPWQNLTNEEVQHILKIDRPSSKLQTISPPILLCCIIGYSVCIPSMDLLNSSLEHRRIPCD